MNAAAASPSDEYFDDGPSEYTDTGGARGSLTAGLDRASTSKANSSIVSYFQKLAEKLIFKSIVKQYDPAWKRAFMLQDLAGISDKDMPAVVLAQFLVPLFPFGDPTAPITPFGMIYLGLAFLEPLSENFNSLLPRGTSVGIDQCGDFPTLVT